MAIRQFVLMVASIAGVLFLLLAGFLLVLGIGAYFNPLPGYPGWQSLAVIGLVLLLLGFALNRIMKRLAGGPST